MQIEFDSTLNAVTVNGCAIALEVLAALSGIEPNMIFRFARNDSGAVIVEAYRITHGCADGTHGDRVTGILVNGNEAARGNH
jgi:hypothetical protein